MTIELRCKNVACPGRNNTTGIGKKLGEAEAPTNVEIKCSFCKQINTFVLTSNEENQTAPEQQSFIKNYEKTAHTYRRTA